MGKKRRESLHHWIWTRAFDGESPNTGVIRDIIDSISIPVQIGGGFRDKKIDLFMESRRSPGLFWVP